MSASSFSCSGTGTYLEQDFENAGIGSRNPDGYLTSYDVYWSPTCSGETDQYRYYSYDSAGRLLYQGTSAQGSSADNFTYDAAGDPTTISEHSSGNFDTFDQSFDSAGELTTQSPAAGSGGSSSIYSYDTMGDQTKITSGSSTTNYGYNQIGQMISATTPSVSATYAYDGDGLVSAISSGGSTSQLTWNTSDTNSGGLSLILSDGTNDYIYGPGTTPVEQVSLATSAPTYLTYTASDDTWLATNSSGDLTGFWGYDAYGTLAFGTPASPFGYGGQYEDPLTGLVNMRARWFQPQGGEFTGRDQLFNKTDTAYLYASDDPINHTDPSGDSINLQGVANWALANWHGGNNGYSDDCTDFVSRSLYFGGGDPQNDGVPSWDPDPELTAFLNRTNNHYWFRDSFHFAPFAPPDVILSYTWGGAYNLADHFVLNGSRWLKYWSQAQPGDIAFANWNNYNFSGISHSGVVTRVVNGLPYITQHTPDQIDLPLTYWLDSHSTVGIWIAVPNPS